ncbi:polyamine transporter 4 [Aspergillus japonicus CBS 114.51]|uniref:Polyamine transporter 4 n=2 Tax=Aspergillus TaxID=5052 RepID=A0A2V5I1B0_ASPV1|nr:polyamine transporter 4 [Aspergillus japonicus CBS 114.51]PYI17897.1 polyamine transporter 4 [Aspergillus violaceofuscus CBS 115571]RAH79159.1 polyamine transporter 4 [Aspergillus japonicus CBS 114.51]
MSLPTAIDVVEKGTDGFDTALAKSDHVDPDHPQNWAMAKKVRTIIILGLLNILGTAASSILSPGQKEIMQQFNIDQEVAILTTTLFLVGYIFGFLTFGPLSEKFGRKWPLIIGVTVSSLFELMPALSTNITTILLGRFFAGLFGISPVAVMGGVVSDCFATAQRGTAMAIAVGLMFSGPTFGPVFGGFIVASSLHWRWTMWVIIICGLGLSLIAVLLFPETYPPIVLDRAAAAASAEQKDVESPSIDKPLDVPEKESLSLAQVARLYLIRPFWLISTQPILFLLTLYQSILYGILYLFYQSYPYTYGDLRGWRTGLNTLPLLGINVGVALGALAMILYNALYFRHHCHDPSTGQFIPESRLPPMILGAIFIPVGMFWYAWTASPAIYWASSVCSNLFIGCGMYLLFIQGFSYIVDCYTAMANSALGVNGAMRSVFAASFPLFATQMLHGLGVAEATTVLGAVCVVLVPVPVGFWYWGGRLRAWSEGRVFGG